MAKSKKQTELEQQLGELTQDLQRTRADFENYRKRVDEEKVRAKQLGQEQAVVKLLPIIDTVERAVAHFPEELKGNKWAEGVTSISKNLTKLFDDLGLEKIEVIAGETEFNPELHNAISADEAEGDREIVTEELQAGYMLSGSVIRESLVRVTRK